MLSIKNITKNYGKKESALVRALKGVNIDFPDKGMVFLLGRSGSGKSTLLNIIGGLDSADDGEIIVKGVSSKNFTPADFDSYRNTFIGFVFQEYNLLNEFTVKQNIALAMQLQSKQISDEELEHTLELVDLAGLKDRYPNELSGGQMQRVAIARAIIKNPEIVLADEPTGALDSATGKQIFDTLKKLSKTRLVVVVSHDRGFAEEYADRIIELSDGEVVLDVSKNTLDNSSSTQNVNLISDDIITIKDWSKVSDEEVKKIIDLMKKNGKETIITSSEKHTQQIKQVLDIEDNSSKKFVKTKKEDTPEYKGEKAKFIKSKLPFSRALKMASSSLKVKPFRLIFTIILSVIAFTLFGITSTLMLYDPNYSVINAMQNTSYESVALEKKYDANYQTVQYKDDATATIGTDMTVELKGAYKQSELDKLNDNSVGLKFAGVMDLGYYSYTSLTTGKYNSREYKIPTVLKSRYLDYYCVTKLIGFTDCGNEFITKNGFTSLANGYYPRNYGEIAIPEYVFDMYKYASNLTTLGISPLENPQDILGETITFNGLSFVVTDVYKVGVIPEEFKPLKDKQSFLDTYQKNQLKKELTDLIEYSFHTVGFVSENFYDYYKDLNVTVGSKSAFGMHIKRETEEVERGDYVSVYTPSSISDYAELVSFYDLDGNVVDYDDSENGVYLCLHNIVLEKYKDIRDKLKPSIENNTANDSQIELYDAVNTYGRQPTFDKAILIYKALRENQEYGLNMPSYYQAKNYKGEIKILTVKGIYLISKGQQPFNSQKKFFISDTLFDNFSYMFSKINGNNINYFDKYTTNYDLDAFNEKYSFVITKTDNTREQTAFMFNTAMANSKNVMLNDVYDLSVEVAGIFNEMKLGFLVAGLVVGLFAVLMLYNFISVAIENKKNEIGILRAVGASGGDVFKIFITEALIITSICFVLSSILSVIACSVINTIAVASIVKISFLNFRFINVLFLLLTSIIIAFVGTFLPVLKASKCSPVESIKAIN